MTAKAATASICMCVACSIFGNRERDRLATSPAPFDQPAKGGNARLAASSLLRAPAGYNSAEACWRSGIGIQALGKQAGVNPRDYHITSSPASPPLKGALAQAERAEENGNTGSDEHWQRRRGIREMPLQRRLLPASCDAGSNRAAILAALHDTQALSQGVFSGKFPY
jgi:hypothetical protein